MKQLFNLVFLFFVISVFGQNSDTNLPHVEFISTNEEIEQPTYFINGEFINSSILSTLDPMLIDSIYVEKENLEIEGHSYYGKIHLRMKEEYNPKYVSLTELSSKYLIQTESPIIYMIDNTIVKGNFDNYLVDEKFIKKILIDEVMSNKNNINIQIIKLVTKRKENDESIMIRGLKDLTLYKDYYLNRK